MPYPRRLSLFLLIAALVASAPVAALSIFDVIQLAERGYDDEAIIDLIDATGSVFELEAEDLPRLKKLGVSEAVVRAMLERTPGDQSNDLPIPNRAVNASERQGQVEAAVSTDRHDHATQDHSDVGTESGADKRRVYDEAWRTRPRSGKSTESTVPMHLPEADPPDHAATKPLVSFRDFYEERGGSHPHMVITLSGLEILILRDEGAFASMNARAQEVAQRLETALALGDGSCFSVSTASGPTVVFQSASTHQRVTLIEVTNSDARSYEIRSGRQVTTDLLAAYWSDLLSDFIAIAMGRSPKRTVALHHGEALGMLYKALRNSAGQGRGGLLGAADLLPSSVRHHLERLTAGVPIDYEPRPQ